MEFFRQTTYGSVTIVELPDALLDTDRPEDYLLVLLIPLSIAPAVFQ